MLYIQENSDARGKAKCLRSTIADIFFFWNRDYRLQTKIQSFEDKYSKYYFYLFCFIEVYYFEILLYRIWNSSEKGG